MMCRILSHADILQQGLKAAHLNMRKKVTLVGCFLASATARRLVHIPHKCNYSCQLVQFPAANVNIKKIDVDIIAVETGGGPM